MNKRNYLCQFFLFVLIAIILFFTLINLFKPTKILEDNFTLYGNDLYQIGGAYYKEGNNIIIGDTETGAPGHVVFKFDLGPSDSDYSYKYYNLKIGWQGQEGKGLHSTIYGKEGSIVINDNNVLILKCTNYAFNTYYYVSPTESEIAIENISVSLLSSRYQYINLSVERNVFWDINKIVLLIGKTRVRNLIYETAISIVAVVSLLNLFDDIRSKLKK